MKDPNGNATAIANAHRLQAAGWIPLPVQVLGEGLAGALLGHSDTHLLWICPGCSAAVDEPAVHQQASRRNNGNPPACREPVLLEETTERVPYPNGHTHPTFIGCSEAVPPCPKSDRADPMSRAQQLVDRGGSSLDVPLATTKLEVTACQARQDNAVKVGGEPHTCTCSLPVGHPHVPPASDRHHGGDGHRCPGCGIGWWTVVDLAEADQTALEIPLRRRTPEEATEWLAARPAGSPPVLNVHADDPEAEAERYAAAVTAWSADRNPELTAADGRGPDVSWLETNRGGQHVCAMPSIKASDRIETGDVWRCDACGICHEVTVDRSQLEAETRQIRRDLTSVVEVAIGVKPKVIWKRLGRTRDRAGVWSG